MIGKYVNSNNIFVYSNKVLKWLKDVVADAQYFPQRREHSEEESGHSNVGRLRFEIAIEEIDHVQKVGETGVVPMESLTSNQRPQNVENGSIENSVFKIDQSTRIGTGLIANDTDHLTNFVLNHVLGGRPTESEVPQMP